MSGYLKVGEITGESTDEGHQGWINLLSVGTYMTRPMVIGASGSTRHRSSVRLGDLTCIKEVDASTPKLQEALADGTSFPKVCVDLCTSSEGSQRIPYLTWELANARVTSYSIDATTDGEDLPTEQIAFNFEKIKVTYDRLDKNNKSLGKVEFTWNLESGVK
ncbi:MAG: type VI secretion system tube protein Hcp [Planctomycetales bacterium]|nr:type VI secretion system tube protein Hcp [Planctomycetales bacterium]